MACAIAIVAFLTVSRALVMGVCIASWVHLLCVVRLSWCMDEAAVSVVRLVHPLSFAFQSLEWEIRAWYVSCCWSSW